MGITYKDAGVDITAGNESVGLIKESVKKTFREEVLTDLGGFAGMFALDTKKYKNPVLISGTDGVGTKLKIAFDTNKHDTIGIDAVAMCVNDILVQGAEPLFFLDYLAVGKLHKDAVTSIVKGVSDGCIMSNCSLIGGETAEMPGFYNNDEYDIAGFAVGVVDRENIINGQDIESGDVIIALPSSGIHSNGFSLARKVLFDIGKLNVDDYVEELGSTLGEELLKPTRIYVKDILPLIEKYNIKGMSHITGGGLIENIPRVFGEGFQANIDLSKWEVPNVFKLIKRIGDVDKEEMYRVFNMGVGYCIIASASDAEGILRDCSDAFVIGNISTGDNKVHFIGE